MEVSIWDVAKRAGVSKSTVSRALNGDPVSQASYEKVIAAVKELGYRPNYMARGPVSYTHLDVYKRQMVCCRIPGGI